MEPDVGQYCVRGCLILCQPEQLLVFSTGCYKPESADLAWPIDVQEARAIWSRVITIPKIRCANIQSAKAVERPSSQISEVGVPSWPNPDVPTVAIGRSPFGRVKPKCKVAVEAVEERLLSLNCPAKAKLFSEAETGRKHQRRCHGEDAIHDHIVPSRSHTRGAPRLWRKNRFSSNYTARHLPDRPGQT
jgi:hypothetical protein